MKFVTLLIVLATGVAANAQSQDYFQDVDANEYELTHETSWGGRGGDWNRGGWERDDWGRGNRGPGRGPGRPGPGPGRPAPRPVNDPCQGTIQGTWSYKGGRSMSITLYRQNYEYVSVTVSQPDRGAETLNGYCRMNHDGSAAIDFNGGLNNGNLFVDAYGGVSGNVAGFGFSGRKY